MTENHFQMEDKKIYKKGDGWSKAEYKKYLVRLLSRHADHDRVRRVQMAELFDYYYNQSSNATYKNLLTVHEAPGEGDESLFGQTPFELINFDAIGPKVNLLLGELDARGFDLRINAINKASVYRKMGWARQLKYLMQMQAMFRRAEEYTGIEYGVNENMPQNEAEMVDYLKGRRDRYEGLIEKCLKDKVKIFGYKHLRKNIFLDLIVVNETHGKIEKINGIPRPRRINPMNCIADYADESDFQDSASTFLEAYYIPIVDAIEKFSVSEERMKELIEAHEKGNTPGGHATISGLSSTALVPFLRRHGDWNGYGYDRVLIVEGEWKSVETLTQKKTYDKHGGEHIHNYRGRHKSARLTTKEKQDKRNTIAQKPIQVVRFGVFIAGEHLEDWGIKEDLVRDPDNPAITDLSYVSFIHNYNNQDSVSLVERMRALQDFKNYVLTIMQKEITTNIGSLVEIDVAQISDMYGADKEAVRNLIHGAKSYRVILKDSSKDAIGFGQNATPLSSVESRSQRLIVECLSIAEYVDRAIEQISGINEARMGTSGERTLVSTNQMNWTQSAMTTRTYFEGFQGWEERLFAKWANFVAQDWQKNPEKYEVYAMELGYQIDDTFAMDLQRFHAGVLTEPQTLQDFLRTMELSLAQGNLQPYEYNELVLIAKEDSVREAMREHVKIMRRKEAMMMEMQQQQQQTQIQAAQQEKQMDYQGEMAKIDRKGRWDLEAARTKGRDQMDQTALAIAQKDRAETNKRIMSQENEVTQ